MPNGFVVTGNPERNTIANIDIWSLVSRIDRMRIEVNRCQSANLPSGLLAADNLRLTDFVGDISSFVARIAANPIPDAPETGGHLTVELPSDEKIDSPLAVENEDVRSIGMLLVQFRTEVQNSQSARLPQGLIPIPVGKPGDHQRFVDFVARITGMIAYAAAQEPSDRPESTPSAMPTAPGSLGD